MRLHAAAATLALSASLALAGCGGGSSHPASVTPARLSVTGAYIPMPSSPDMAAGYFVLRNSGDRAATLNGVSSPQAQSVTMHRSTATTMVPLDSVTVPAHGEVVFARGGRHLMLMGLATGPAVGQRVQLRLSFTDAPALTTEATVQPLTYQPAQSGQ